MLLCCLTFVYVAHVIGRHIYIYIFCIIIGTDQVRPEGSEVPNPNSYVGGMFWRHLGIVGMVLTDSLMPIVTE
jgi:hypothetical protein